LSVSSRSRRPDSHRIRTPKEPTRPTERERLTDMLHAFTVRVNANTGKAVAELERRGVHVGATEPSDDLITLPAYQQLLGVIGLDNASLGRNERERLRLNDLKSLRAKFADNDGTPQARLMWALIDEHDADATGTLDADLLNLALDVSAPGDAAARLSRASVAYLLHKIIRRAIERADVSTDVREVTESLSQAARLMALLGVLVDDDRGTVLTVRRGRRAGNAGSAETKRANAALVAEYIRKLDAQMPPGPLTSKRIKNMQRRWSKLDPTHPNEKPPKERAPSDTTFRRALKRK
jgi:hypothetical protein